MPRITFYNKDELLKWCNLFVKPENYVGYTTVDCEIILEPRKSTRPSRFAFFNARDESMNDLVKEIADKTGITFIKIAKYEWDTERMSR